MQRFRGGLVFKAHRVCVSLNSRLESNKEEEKRGGVRGAEFTFWGVSAEGLGLGFPAIETDGSRAFVDTLGIQPRVG